MTYKQEIAEILLKTRSVMIRVDPPFRWVSGILAPIYTDNRILMSFPEERNIIVDHFVEIIRNNGHNPDVIAGIATSGIPWAAWIADRLDLPMIYIRKRSKDHGKENLIEGKLEKGQKVIIIEDLISTGGSSISGVQAIKSADAEVILNLAIFTYELPKAAENFDHEGISLITLTDFSTLIAKAVEINYLSDDQKQKALEWKSIPDRWGKE